MKLGPLPPIIVTLRFFFYPPFFSYFSLFFFLNLRFLIPFLRFAATRVGRGEGEIGLDRGNTRRFGNRLGLFGVGRGNCWVYFPQIYRFFSIEKALKFSSRFSRIKKKERRERERKKGPVRLHGYSTSDLFMFRVVSVYRISRYYLLFGCNRFVSLSRLKLNKMIQRRRSITIID